MDKGGPKLFQIFHEPTIVGVQDSEDLRIDFIFEYS